MLLTSLIGNGSSVVYNPLLRIGPLTESIVGAFSGLAGTDAALALAAFANQVNGNDGDDFEGLLGPLDAITQALPILGGAAAPFANVGWVAGPLAAASEALRRLHRLGLATALSLIAERAFGQGQDALDAGVGILVNGLREVADGSLLTIATLNYDGLLQAAVPDEHVADLATGQGVGPVQLAPGVQLLGWPLRALPDFPEDRNVHLLHLHGSLGWLRGPNGTIWKFRIDDLRAIEFWALLRDLQADVDPVVVLTDRKEAVVASDPFAFAYSIFANRLIKTRHWCAAGYSFLDTPVNRSFIDAVEARRSLDLPEPKLLVLGHGDSENITNLVTEKLGEATPEVFVDGTGLPLSVGGAAWNAWRQP